MEKSYDVRALAPTVCKILGVRTPRTANVEPLLEVFETMGVQDRLAVVVIDAFGASTWAQVRMETPTFNAFANRHLLHLMAVMPTVTPVNFATMLTGASPDVHLIRSREDELTLETIFDVLRSRGKTSATAARALSTLGILLSPFADHSGIAESNDDDEVSTLAVKAMKGHPDLLWVQLLDVDDAGHKHGPVSSQGIAAAKRADVHLREMAVEAFWQGYSIMVLADHGQHTVNGFDGSVVGTHGTIVDEDVYVPLVWCRPGELGEALGLA